MDERKITRDLLNVLRNIGPFRLHNVEQQVDGRGMMSSKFIGEGVSRGQRVKVQIELMGDLRSFDRPEPRPEFRWEDVVEPPKKKRPRKKKVNGNGRLGLKKPKAIKFIEELRKV